jgi:hypothetical protein
VIGIQGGITVLRYADLEVRAIYQYYSNHTLTFQTDQNSLYLNPRWNNFIDILDFPKGKPINRVIRHVLFGPLEDRAVPYVGLLGGATLPGPGNTWPGHLIGAQVGVRFRVARGFSVDTTLQYSQYGIDFQGEAGQAQQWLITTGFGSKRDPLTARNFGWSTSQDRHNCVTQAFGPVGVTVAHRVDGTRVWAGGGCDPVGVAHRNQ